MIAVVALIVFGPEKLPEMGRRVGSFVADVRRMSDDVRSEFHGVMDEGDDDPFFPEDENSTAASTADETDAAARNGRAAAGQDDTSSPPERVDT